MNNSLKYKIERNSFAFVKAHSFLKKYHSILDFGFWISDWYAIKSNFF